MLASARRNQLLVLGCLAGLLAGASPVMAFSSFDVLFDGSTKKTSSEATGVSGKMTFSFKKKDPLDSKYILDLTIQNTSQVPGSPSGRLTAFAFNVPGASKKNPDFKLLEYEPLISNFGDVFGASTVRGAEVNVENNKILKFPDRTPRSTAAYAPFSNFTFCARDDGQKNCHGGSGNTNFGLADGEKTSVRFTLSSNLANINSASLVAQSFYDLFKFRTFTEDGDYKTAQIALRFQSVTTSTGRTNKSDKVAGYPSLPPQGPGDEVPGPLPILGAATAFAFSRKLRHRIASSPRQTAKTA